MIESVDYQAVLADLKARRVRLDQLIAGIEAVILGQGDAGALEVGPVPSGAPVSTGPLPTLHADTFFGLGIADAAKKYLRMARRAQHTAAIADAIGQGGLKRPGDNVLSSILVRAAKGREVVKVGRGMWGLSEFYPRRQAEPVEEPKKRPRARKGRGRKGTIKKETDREASAASASTNGATTSRGGRPSEVAMEIIRAAPKPLHVKEIVRLIESRGVSVNRAALEAGLNRRVKMEKLKRPAPRTFSL